MARVVLVALAWCAVRGEEYVGGAMPQYGNDYERALLDEYRGHSPDAPAPLDYKYEEDLPGTTEKPPKYVEDAARWRKSPRMQRRPAQDVKEELELQGIEEDSDVGSNAKPSRRRPRLRTRGRRGRERPPRRRAGVAAVGRYGRVGRKDDDAAHYLDDIDYRDDRSKYLKEEDHISPKETTAKIIRRKPRDRMFAPPPPPIPQRETSETPESEAEEFNPNRRLKGDSKFDDTDYWSAEEGGKSGLRPDRPILPDIESELENFTQQRGRQPVTNPDYNEYYDMKKVIDIKSKLPTLLRRSTTPVWDRPHTTPTDELEVLWPARRAGNGGPPLVSGPPASTRTPDHTPVTTTDTTATTATTAVVTTTSISTAAVSPDPTPLDNTTELSLAEKSRLSILKKAQMKEKVKSAGMMKPPVLLSATGRMPTVVMVEPATSPDPWMRAREVDGNSPETLDRVKQLMRKKLVASAKSIRDLTDNWDDTVCDYIDVSMLEDGAPARPRASSCLLAAAAAHLAQRILNFCAT